MFIRWKTRKQKDSWDSVDSITHFAYLLESVRTGAGPRQRHLAYLGCAISREGKFSVSQGKLFWRQVETRLASLELPALQVEKLMTALQKRVPQPSEEEVQHHAQEVEKELQALSTLCLP